MSKESIQIKWYVTDQEPLFQSKEGPTLVLEGDGIGVFEEGCMVTLHVDLTREISQAHESVRTLLQAVREGVQRGEPWRSSRACFYGVIQGNLIGLAYAIDGLKPTFQSKEYDYLEEEECSKLGVPYSVESESITLEKAYFHTGNSGVALEFEVDDFNGRLLKIRLSSQGNAMITTIPMGSMEMVGWLHEATGRLLKEMATSHNEGRTFPFEYHPQGEVCVEEGKKIEQYFSWDANGKHLLQRRTVSNEGPGFAMSGSEFIEVPTPCCERDHNKDGNCDRHPGSKV